MPDREKVIRDLRYLKSFGRVSNNPQITEIAEEFIALLKEQEVKPILIREGKSKLYNDYHCPRCGQEIVYEQNYCCECGSKVKWE